MTEATLVLTPKDSRIGKSRQVPAITVKPEDREKDIEAQCERAFHKYHRRGIDATLVGTESSASGSKLIVALYCAASDDRIGEVHVTKEER